MCVDMGWAGRFGLSFRSQGLIGIDGGRAGCGQAYRGEGDENQRGDGDGERKRIGRADLKEQAVDQARAEERCDKARDDANRGESGRLAQNEHQDVGAIGANRHSE